MFDNYLLLYCAEISHCCKAQDDFVTTVYSFKIPINFYIVNTLDEETTIKTVNVQ